MSRKILVFCGGFIVSGAEVITLSYIKELLKWGYKVHFIISKWTDGELKKRLNDLDIPYTEVKLGFIYLRRPLWTLDTLIHYPAAVWKILNTINEFKPDLTYHMSYRSLFMLRPFLKCRNFYHVHDAIPATRWNKFILKSISGITNKFIAVSYFTKLNLQKCGVNSKLISVIHNGVMVPKTILRAKIHCNSVRIGLVGQINYTKGHHLVIEALSEKRFAGKKIILKIFGKGNPAYIEDLKQMIIDRDMRHRVEWCGFVGDTNELYSLIDILIVPSINPETFGMVAIEAGINKVLVLSAAIGGLLEIITDKVTGYLFKSSEALGLADTLEFALNNETLSLDCIESNFKSVQKNFNVANQTIILRDLLMDKNSKICCSDV